MTDRPPPLIHFPSLERFSGLLHGISTRRGGVSNGPFASLNLGWTVGDAPENVEANYRRLAQALGVPREHLTTTWQVHGCRVVRATLGDRGRSLDKADGIVTDAPDLPLSQRYADCTPLLVYDPVRHVTGIGHAGWRGTVASVAGALVAALADQFGSRPVDLVAVIGPAIGPCCYEVGPEVVAAVQNAFAYADDLLVRPAAHGARLERRTHNGRLHFDLWEANRRQFIDAGVVQVEVARVCTSCHRDTFFSHRGHHGQTGRFAGIVMLRG